MTVQEIINLSKNFVRDSGVDPDWGETEWLLTVNTSLRRFYREHPESRIKTDGTLLSFVELSSTGETIPLDDIYFEPFARYCSFLFFSSDANDRRDENRARLQFDLYRQLTASQ